MKTKFQLLLLALIASTLSALAVQVNITFHADGAETTVKREAGTAYRINTLISDPVGCRGYNFVGWKTDGPVEGDGTPAYQASNTNITPSANMNLYAVYRRTGAAADRYTRITSTSELHAGSQYLIVCFYEWDGDTYYGPSYWALGNTQSVGEREATSYTYTPYGTTYDVYATCYRISATQVSPNAGVIEGPVNAIVWNLTGEEDAWYWTNAANSKRLYLRRGWQTSYYRRNGNWNTIGTYNEEILTNTGGTCSVTAANGAFNFEKDGYYLTYSEDEDDYFKMGTSNDWTFYLYKKEAEYTSFPNCSQWTVHLDALDGKISGTSPASSTTDVYETASGSQVVNLPTASIADAACSSWSFAGWYPETPIQGTTETLTLYNGTYSPTYDGTTLYAVYQAGEDATYWERITNWDELQSGDICVIATKTGNDAVTAPYNNGYARTNVNVNGRRLRNAPDESIQWTFNGTYFANGTTTLSDNGTRTTRYYYESSGNEPFVLAENSYDNYYLYDNGSKFVEQRANTTEFYIYKKVTTYATRSSFPHCTPFSVTLNVAGGKFKSTGSRESITISEPSAGAGIDLSNYEVEPLCPEDGWEFAGWQEGSEVGSVKELDYTGLHKDSYAPSRNGVTLYAVFKRPIPKFQILYQPTEMVAGDKYIITGYDGTYDWEITSTQYNNNYLLGTRAAAPMGEEGYFIEEDEENAMWVMNGTYDNCTFQNVATAKYLASDNTNPNGHTTTANTGTAYNFARPTTAFYFTMRDRTTSKYMRHEGTNHYFYTNNSSNERFYVYRQMSEFTSWPHCDPFTVNFDGCGGNAGAASLTEEAAYAGITLPDAYANSDCSKEGWEFVGWATEPISEESSSLPLDVLPAGTTYNPPVNNGTLYAVYQQKTNTYKRISSLADLRIGLNYIIATSGNRAMSNTAQNTNYVASKAVTPASNVITSDDVALEWRVQGTRGAFEFYNADRNVYLDLSTAGYALLTSGSANDQFVIIVQSGVFYVRSIQALTSTKYLGFTSNYFNTVDDENLPTLYFYQQQATYHSYPMCAESVDALRWDKEGNDYYVYVESYVLTGTPNMTGAMGDPTAQADGTYKFLYNTTAAPAGSKKPLTWAGTTSRLNIPFVVAANANINAIGLPAKSEECDVVVLSGKTLTVNANKTIHNLTLYDNASLVVNTGVTLTVNSLILFTEGDVFTNTNSGQNITFNGTGNIVLKNGEMYHDRRIDENRYYWMTLPFDAQVQQVSYSNLEANGKSPVYRTDFWVKYYNGALRAADVNGSSLATTYWSHVAAKGGDYTIQAGQGYNVGIADQANTTQADGRKHTKRVLRFTMKPGDSWADAEKNSTKVVNVEPSSANDDKNAAHVGWNLVGNPYLHAYAPGDANDIVTGVWEKDDDGYYVITEGATATVPYFTLYNPSAEKGKRYSQVRTSTHTLRPYEAVFVQINSGNQMYFKSTGINRSSAPAYMRAADPDVPFYTGIELRGNNTMDRTGVVLCDEYTPAYEIGADLIKISNEGALNLYTINQYEQPLAFNGLSDDDAIAPIPVGVTFPATGEYTFAFDFDHYDIYGLEVLELIDKAQGTTTDLLLNDYSFVTNAAGTVNDRFQIVVRRAQAPQVPTGMDETYDYDAAKPRKIIRDGQLFIIYDDKVYNAVGVEIK